MMLLMQDHWCKRPLASRAPPHPTRKHWQASSSRSSILWETEARRQVVEGPERQGATKRTKKTAARPPGAVSRRKCLRALRRAAVGFMSLCYYRTGRCIKNRRDRHAPTHGFFTFDVWFPPTYPSYLPWWRSSRREDTYRFNPNLYADGKVCLSLLGTWKASDESEKWDPSTGSLRQILLSIQHQIL